MNRLTCSTAAEYQGISAFIDSNSAWNFGTTTASRKVTDTNTSTSRITG